MAISQAANTPQKPAVPDRKPEESRPSSSSVPIIKRKRELPQVTVEMCPPPSSPPPRPRSPTRPLTRCQILRARYPRRPEDVGKTIRITCQLTRMKPADYPSPYLYFVAFEKLMTQQDRMGFAMKDSTKSELLLRAITILVKEEGEHLRRSGGKGKLDYIQLLAQMKKKYHPNGSRMAVQPRPPGLRRSLLRPQPQALKLPSLHCQLPAALILPRI
ncbi:hypothetical protein Sste5346_002911 [Sporothrix stenoceras]|uniref:Uncharacterized protein n=1 Tax=Sporothrix stenoceras TaxID=5173 RepID=A0ABR3ZGT3_9PEZI